MSWLGGPEMLVILLVIVLLFGAKKLPDMARSLGRSMRIFKAEVEEMKHDSPRSAASSDTVPGEAAPRTGATAATGQPVYEQPVQPPVGAQAQQPVYEQPMQQPVYQQPVAPQPQQPVYQQPVAPQPQQPVYQQSPTTQQATYRPGTGSDPSL